MSQAATTAAAQSADTTPIIPQNTVDKIHAERAAMAQAILGEAVAWEHIPLPLSDGTTVQLPVKIGQWAFETEYGEMPEAARMEWEIVIIPTPQPVPKIIADALRATHGEHVNETERPNA